MSSERARRPLVTPGQLESRLTNQMRTSGRGATWELLRNENQRVVCVDGKGNQCDYRCMHPPMGPYVYPIIVKVLLKNSLSPHSHDFQFSLYDRVCTVVSAFFPPRSIFMSHGRLQQQLSAKGIFTGQLIQSCCLLSFFLIAINSARPLYYSCRRRTRTYMAADGSVEGMLADRFLKSNNRPVNIHSQLSSMGFRIPALSLFESPSKIAGHEY